MSEMGIFRTTLAVAALAGVAFTASHEEPEDARQSPIQARAAGNAAR